MSPDPSRFGLDRHTKFLLLVGFMIASMASLSALPFLLPWGADLHNVHVYEHCTHGRSPYLIGGPECGDFWRRSFPYPPLLYALFFWTRSFTLATSMRIWGIFLYAAFIAIFHVWTRLTASEPLAKGDPTRCEVPVFCALLLFQYPFVFALERGNTDTVTVLFYTAGAYLFTRRRLWLAGAAVGVAAGFKLHPVLAVAALVMSLLLALRDPDRRVGGGRQVGKLDWLRFGGGALVAFAATLLAFPESSLIYLRKMLPAFAATFTPDSEFGHSVSSAVGSQYPGFANLICGALLGLWGWAGARAIARGEEAWALAGALAVCTYASRTSWDYNLVTTYPLLLLLFLRARRTDRWSLLAFGLFVIAGDRRLFKMPNAQILTAQLHLTLQLAFLAMTALVVARGDAPAVAMTPTDDEGSAGIHPQSELASIRRFQP